MKMSYSQKIFRGFILTVVFSGILFTGPGSDGYRGKPGRLIAAGEVRLDFENAPLEDVIRALALQSGENIVLGSRAGMDPQSNYQAPLFVNISLRGMKPLEALETICKSLGLHLYEYGDVYYIDRPILQEAEQRRVTRTLYLGELPYIDKGGSSGGSEENRIEEIFKQAISSMGKMTVLPEANSVVVTDFPDRIQVLEDIVEFLKYHHSRFLLKSEEQSKNRYRKLKVRENRVYLDYSENDLITNNVFTLGEFCDYIGKYIGKPVLVSPDERFIVINFPIQGLTPRAALLETARTLGTSFREDDEKINVGRSYLQTRIIPLKNLSLSSPNLAGSDDRNPSLGSSGLVTRVQNILNSLSNLKVTNIVLRRESLFSSSGSSSSSSNQVSKDNNSFMQNSIYNLGTSYEEEEVDFSPSNLDVDGKTNQLIVTSTPYILADFERAVKKLDVERRQILIESYFLEINNDVFDRLGFNWALTDNSGQNPLYTANINLNPTSNIGQATINFNLKEFTIAGLVQFLEQNNYAKVISKPRILVLENEMATMKVSSRVWFVESTDVQVTNGVTTTTQNVKSEDIDITMKVIPRLQEGGLINLEIFPKVRSLQGFQTLGTDNFPVIAEEEAQTVLDVKNNHTIAIGGLLKNQENKNDNAAPFISKIPLIGKLFQNNEKESRKSELVIFVTPHIVGKGIRDEKLGQLKNKEKVSAGGPILK